MDDNLTIHLDDYLKDPIIVEKHKFTRDIIISAIKQSEIYIYDFENDAIKLRLKPKRRIIVFRDISKKNQSKEEIERLLKCSKENKYDQQIQKIEILSDLILVYFENEEITIEIFRWLENLKENKEEVN